MTLDLILLWQNSKDKFDIGLYCYNIFDEQYYYMPDEADSKYGDWGFEQAGRNIQMKISMKF